ncbi:PH domain-like protein [Neocallimastix lanati (nom. inval.)]|uniref:PH domain-like protein n=1 Tax=Neocallimastix californiae TaxID=1754190 RepID=A0A1Y2DPU1_9FUNG|nr:PH domain-like protein [Neocallimastix sp. JGI-2020a]ORY61126.1 PH domain-like protein [Neocallimastix californiae]|eukprot:ORY61126.1 PH domain-like protein [Neocallimastix californiae]
MTTENSKKRERDLENVSEENETENVKINEKETKVDEKAEENKKSSEKKVETSNKSEIKNNDDKTEKEPTSKKQKIGETETNSSQKKIFGSSVNVSLSSFASYSKPTKSIFGSSGNSNSFDTLLKSEGKPFDKKIEKEENKNSQFKETDTKTGEEDEECIHSIRAKLYEDENNSWKERGIGLLKINCNKENKSKVRLVMRAEGILRVILNERIIPGMKFSVIQDKYISFAAISDAKTIKKYLVKCGSTMSANELYQALVKATPKE